MKATASQRDQIDDFVSLMKNNLDSVILHPVIERSSGEERLGICVVNRAEGRNDIYLVGLWLLPGDSMFKRVDFKEDEPEVLTEKRSLWKAVKNFVPKVCRWFYR